MSAFFKSSWDYDIENPGDVPVYFHAETFDFEYKNSYTIHVKASDGNEEYETDFIIVVEKDLKKR